MDLGWLEHLAQAGTATGTGIVLWTQFGRPWWRRPRLELRFHPDSPGARVITQVTLNRDGKPYPAAYLRLDVVAEERKDVARDAELLVAGARCIRADIAAELPLQGSALAWSNVGLRTTEGEAVARPIPPGITRRVDLAHAWIVRPDKLQIDVRPEPTGQPNVVAAPLVELDLILVAANVTPSRWLARVRYDGDFDGQAFPPSLDVQLARVRA